MKKRREERALRRGGESENEARLAYMVAWRDRYIERLEEALQGREEEARINLSLLGFCLRELSLGGQHLKTEESDRQRMLHLPKDAVREALESCYAAVEQDEAEYRILFWKDGGKRADDGEGKEA
jgi:hypothetical protein